MSQYHPPGDIRGIRGGCLIGTRQGHTFSVGIYGVWGLVITQWERLTFCSKPHRPVCFS